MKTSFLIIFGLACFGTMLYYFISDASLHWALHVVLFIVGEISFAIGVGRMMKNAREYHEEYVWIEQDQNNG